MRYPLGMDRDEAESRLTETTATRLAADAAQEQSTVAERAAIVDAWRAGVPPTKIAALSHRTPTHVRNLRPDDVPPARLGGGAARKRRTRKPGA